MLMEVWPKTDTRFLGTLFCLTEEPFLGAQNDKKSSRYRLRRRNTLQQRMLQKKPYGFGHSFPKFSMSKLALSHYFQIISRRSHSLKIISTTRVPSILIFDFISFDGLSKRGS